MQTGALRLLVIANLQLAAVTSASYVIGENGTTAILPVEVTPLLIEILHTEQPLTADREAKISCRFTGARPAANISWWLDGTQIAASSTQKNSANGNESISVLRWTPSMEDDGRKLTCRASHLNLEHSAIESSIYLNLHYVPKVVLVFGSQLKLNDIEEGDDIYFNCVVRANPPASRVVWKHNDQIVIQNLRAGVIVSFAHLVLRRVSIEQSGEYRCTATNDEGVGNSQSVNLQIISKSSTTYQNGSSTTPSDQSKRSGPELAAVMKIGIHVVRGDDWIWGNQDGGQGREGTITSISPRGRVMVKWGDNDDEYLYRTGEDGIYELRLAPSELVQPETKRNTGNEKSGSDLRVVGGPTQGKLLSSSEIFGKLVEKELDKLPEKNRLKLMEDILQLFRSVNATI